MNPSSPAHSGTTAQQQDPFPDRVEIPSDFHLPPLSPESDFDRVTF